MASYIQYDSDKVGDIQYDSEKAGDIQYDSMNAGEGAAIKHSHRQRDPPQQRLWAPGGQSVIWWSLLTPKPRL